MGDSCGDYCHPHGSDPEGPFGQECRPLSREPAGTQAVSQLSAVPSWTSEDSQSESELSDRNFFFSGTLKIVKALAQ